jgi:hypothetical protein
MPRGGRTSGTRIGNGAGYGGNKNGLRRDFKASDEHTVEAAKAGGSLAPGEGKVAKSREALIEASPLAVQIIIDTMQRQGRSADADARTALQAAQSVLNKVGLHDKSGIEHTGADGDPIKVDAISDAELERRLAELFAKIGQGGSPPSFGGAAEAAAESNAD